MKALLKFLVWLVVLAAAVLYGGGSFAADKLTHKYLPRVTQMLSANGLDVGGLDYRTAHFSGIRDLTWYDLHATVLVEAPAPIRRKRSFDVSVDTVTISPLDLSLSSAAIVARGVSVIPHSAGADASLTGEVADKQTITGEELTGDELSVIVPFTVTDPRPSITTIQNTVRHLLQAGSTTNDFAFTGSVTVMTAKGTKRIRVETTHEGDNNAVVVNRADLKSLSEIFDDKLTDGEIDIISRHPLQAPMLVGIRHKAEAQAKQAATKDPSVPYDAYRYVLWSYLLTKEFGEAFAKSVTDAHEDDPGQPLTERNQDLKNGAVGRAYALRGVPESEILAKCKTDPAVVRNAPK